MTTGQTIINTDIPGVNPGKYMACLPKFNVCQAVTKVKGQVPTVRFSDILDPDLKDQQPEEQNCEGKAGVDGWLLCGVVKITSSALTFMDDRITELLDVDATYYGDSRFIEAWRTIRNISYSILLPITLVMVIATAIGFDFISAYTVRRALPRLVLAAIGIALSYQICVFMVQFFNALGQGTYGIVTAPFGDAGQLTLSKVAGDTVLDAVLQSAGIVLIVVFLWLPLLVGVLTGFIVLIIRQLLIVGLILAAPLALLVWIFPGNDKLWNLWWGAFTRILLMYPMIMGLLALGRVFAWLIAGPTVQGLAPTDLFASIMGTPVLAAIDRNTPFIGGLLAATVYLVPYALIPLTWRGTVILGAAAGAVGGAVAKGGDWVKGARQYRKAEKKNIKQARKREAIETKMNKRIQGKNAPGALGWRRARDTVSQFRYYKQTGQLKYGGMQVLNPFSKTGRSQFRELREQQVMRASGEAIKADTSQMGGASGATALNYAGAMALDKKDWKRLYRQEMEEATGEPISDDAIETAYADQVAAYGGAEAGSAVMRQTARHNYLADATNVNPSSFKDADGNKMNPFSDEARRRAMNKVLMPIMQARHRGEIDHKTAVELFRGNAKRHDQSGGEWGDSSNFITHHFKRYEQGHTGNDLVELGDIDQEGTLLNLQSAVINKSHPGELAQDGYRATFSHAAQYEHEIKRAYQKSTDTRLSEEERKGWDEQLNKYMGEFAGLSESFMQSNPQVKRILQDGLLNKRVSDKGPTLWELREQRRGTRAFQQSYRDFMPPTSMGGGAPTNPDDDEDWNVYQNVT